MQKSGIKAGGLKIRIITLTTSKYYLFILLASFFLKFLAQKLVYTRIYDLALCLAHILKNIY